MIIIWTRWGIFVPVIFLAVLVFTEWTVEAITDDPTYYQTHTWPKVTGMMLVAIVFQLIHFLPFAKQTEYIDPQTEKVSYHGGLGSFFFIPMKYWSYIFAGLGICYYFA